MLTVLVIPAICIVLRGRPGKAWAAAGKPRWKA
jgi:hypothetical protein